MQFNVVGEAIDGALPRIPEVPTRLRALPYLEGPHALDSVDASIATPSAKLALRFLILTAARPGEVRRATWIEIDVAEAVWRIPGERMKAGAEHRVPLSRAALDVQECARSTTAAGWCSPRPFGALAHTVGGVEGA